ncbi:MAG TPA: transglutaminase-like domain-containing protein [Actinopolymorphaceae bacterium]
MSSASRPDLGIATRYTTPGRLTSFGRFAGRLDDLPADPAALARVVQGLVVHEHIAHAYGVTLTDEARRTVHIRDVESLVEQILALDHRSLLEPRPPESRIAGNCRHMTVLFVAMLRAQGIPARARCGFGTYFGTGGAEDHWVCEYWHADEGRWILADAQIDERQQEMFGIDIDPLDVPRDRFLVAGQAWRQCRAGESDPERFGLAMVEEGGYWWIAGNLVRDLAALCDIEMLPWDDWGAMPAPDQPLEAFGAELVDLFDRVASLTVEPDDALPELDRVYEDERLRVPAVVHNAVLNRDEPVFRT